MKTALIVVAVAGPAFCQYGAFALPDEHGARLIATGATRAPANARTALCSGGKSVPVRFDHRQAGTNKHNGRQTPSRFAALSGDVFRVEEGSVAATDACFLPAQEWMSEASVVPVQADRTQSSCDTALQARIVQAKGRAVVHCFSIARVEEGGRLVLVEFVRAGKDALASIVLIDPARLLFADYPAEFRGEGNDLWRADDGGKLLPDGFEIVFLLHRFLLHRPDDCALGVSWNGAEGRSLALFVSTGATGFNRVVDDYWYQSPE